MVMDINKILIKTLINNREVEIITTNNKAKLNMEIQINFIKINTDKVY
jgi:hypothetical protein